MISIINIDEIAKWDCIIKSFKNYDVCYLNRYAKAFQIHGDGEPILIYYDDGNTRAINAVMKRDISSSSYFENKLPSNTYFDLSTPYGYGGFWIEGDNKESVENNYIEYLRENGFVSEFVRFHLFSDYKNYFNGVVHSNTLNVVRTLDIPLDDIYMNFEHKNRKNINKAVKSGLKIEVDSKSSKLNEFLSIYNSTMNRNNAKSNFFFSEEFFKTINQLKDNYIYMHILHDNKIISTELVLYGSENCYSFLGGTEQKYFSLRPNDLLKYEIIKWGKEKGLKRFILGGGYGENDGIFSYKKSFAPNGVINFYIGKRVIDENMYKKLLNIRKKDGFDENSTYFPLYRG